MKKLKKYRCKFASGSMTRSLVISKVVFLPTRRLRICRPIGFAQYARPREASL